MDNNIWDSFEGATESLVQSGPIKDRLTDAYRNYLEALSEDELPKELREDFRRLRHTLTRERALVRGDDAFRATIRKMSSDQADEVALAIVRLFGAIPRGFVPAVRSANGAHVIPLFLAEA